MKKMRLIDADKILKKQEHFVNALVGEMAIVYVEDIENAPTISPDIRSKGRWEAHGIAIVCNQCLRCLVVEQGDADMNFCPNCGADMRGGKT